MKKIYVALLSAFFCPSLLLAQGATDAFNISQTDLKGTARFMSMGGAFGALGGDITTLIQNPAGLGVYRNSELAVTLDFSNQSTGNKIDGFNSTDNRFKFSCNNFGYIAAINLNSDVSPYINFGASYNRTKSFERTYQGYYGSLNTSMSNYIANVTNGISANDLGYDLDSNGNPVYNGGYDPYGNAPWLSVLGYNSFLISPTAEDNTLYDGIFSRGSSTGSGTYRARERGDISEFSLNFGGNIYDVLYYGIGVGVTNFDYRLESNYSERINNGVILGSEKEVVSGEYNIANRLVMDGNGVNFKMGVILRPIDNIRLGFAFHTPTYYTMTNRMGVSSAYNFGKSYQGVQPNSAVPVLEDAYDYDFQSPWRFIASAAYLFGRRGLVSFDYEYTNYPGMSLDSHNYDYRNENNDIKIYYKSGSTFRVGGEYRLTNQLSLRLGYSYQTSPVKQQVLNGREIVYTSGTNTAYTLDRSIQYYTGGLGYRFSNLYLDLAYIFRLQKQDFLPFSGTYDYRNHWDAPEVGKLTSTTNSFVFTLGFKF